MSFLLDAGEETGEETVAISLSSINIRHITRKRNQRINTHLNINKIITIVNKEESVRHNADIVLKCMSVVTTCFGPSRGHHQVSR
jgi:hypothetical protein